MGRLLNGNDWIQEWRQVEREYDFNHRPVNDIRPLQPGICLLIKEEQSGPLLLKKYRLISEDRLAVLDKILAACSRGQITPRLLPNRDGKCVTQTGSGYYSIMEWVHRDSIMPEIHWPEIARILARMHITLSNLPQKEMPSPLAVEPINRKRLLQEKGFSHLAQLVEEIEKENIRFQFLHNDLHPGNIIISATTGSPYILDFESFSTNPLVVDVMFAAFRLFSANQPDLFKQFVYHYETFNPLLPEEKKQGLTLLTADFIKKFAFILSEQEKGNDYFLKDYDNYLGFIYGSLALQKRLAGLDSNRMLAENQAL